MLHRFHRPRCLLPFMLVSLLSPRSTGFFISITSSRRTGLAFLHLKSSNQHQIVPPSPTYCGLQRIGLRKRTAITTTISRSSTTWRCRLDSSLNDWVHSSLLPLAIDRAKRTLSTTATTTAKTSDVVPPSSASSPVGDSNSNSIDAVVDMDTIATKNDSLPEEDSQSLLRKEVVSTMNELLDVISTKSQPQQSTTPTPLRSNVLPSSTSSSPTSMSNSTDSMLPYSEHPAISLTALAHSLWEHTILPYDDVAIDATCGNGHDSVALARLLFPKQSSSASSSSSIPSNHNKNNARLICVDIQPQACVQTQHKLSQELEETILTNHVNVVNDSHERLAELVSSVLPPPQQDATPTLSSLSPPLPPPPRSRFVVGLVVYNLGYLPGTVDKTQHVTQLETTLASLTDAIQLLRIGGMISVMTYSSNPLEQEAVLLLLEAMALLSVKNRTKLLQELFQAPPPTVTRTADHDDNDEDEDASNQRMKMLALVQTAFEQIMQHQNDSCWRVMQHKSLGRPSSPMLTTATRIR